MAKRQQTKLQEADFKPENGGMKSQRASQSRVIFGNNFLCFFFLCSRVHLLDLMNPHTQKLIN